MFFTNFSGKRKTVIRPTVLYGSEVWTLSKTLENKLAIWERKVLRKIFVGKKLMIYGCVEPILN